MPTAGNQLQLSFGINAPESRAIFTDTKLPDNSPVGVRLDGYADYANLVYTGTTTSGTQSWALSEGSVTLTDTKGTLYAYWPYSSTTSIDAIDVDMTAADQTDWLYATPVTGICEDKAEAAVIMNHALANINVTINKGSYLGTGAISNITVQSDGIALGGTFNAAQATPDYDAFENEGEPLSRNITTTTGAATDIMVVPTGASAAITFLATIDGIQFIATSAAVTLEKGNSYVYTLNLSDINTYMTIGSFGVTPWSSKTGGNLNLEQEKPLEGTIDLKTADNGVYVVAQNGKGVAVADADESCVGVALIRTNALTPQRFMIAKNDATDGSNTKFYWAYNLKGKDVKGIANISVEGGYIGDGKDYSTDITTWTTGSVSDLNGKSNTAAIMAGYTEHSVSMDTRDMCKVLETFNEGGYTDWYVPAAGQYALMYLAKTDIEAALEKIGGKVFEFSSSYWSSSEKDSNDAWGVNLLYGSTNGTGDKNTSRVVRFIRDLE